MSKSKSKLSVVIALTALLTLICTLVLPGVCLESQTYQSSDFTYIFGFTSIFGGVVKPVGSNLNCPLTFNLGSFIALALVLVSAILVYIFDKQISSYVFSAILFVISGVLFLFNQRFVIEANGYIMGFTNYLYTAFGTYVSLGLCCLGLLECSIGAYLLKSDTRRKYR